MINRNVCIGGKIENGICKCPNETALIGYNCKPCIGGTIILNRCKCSSGRYLFGNECILIPKFIPDRISLRGPRPIHIPAKPVIYLYPKETMDISVQLNINIVNLQQFILNLMEKIHGKLKQNQMEIF